MPRTRRLRPFYAVGEAERNPAVFQRWFAMEAPDLILTLYHGVRHWLSAMGLGVPADVGLIQLEWRTDHSEWAGMEQHNDVVGAAAVEMLISMIHHGDRGIPDFPRATLIGSSWVDGATVA